MLPGVDCKRTDVAANANPDGDAMAPCPACLKKLRRSSPHSNAIPALNLARAVACALTAVSSVVLAVAPASAADTAIYRCLDNHLGLVYTDLPCKDGEKLDIRAGDADPAAVARLERLRDQLDQSTAERIVDERQAAERSALANRLRRETEQERGVTEPIAAYAPFDYGYAYVPFLPDARTHPPRAKAHSLFEPRRFAPRPPYFVPKP
jgi:hypothetical protein